MQYKILILSLTYLPYIGGAEIAVKETTNRLGADFCFDMVTARLNRKLPKFEKINNINIYRIGFGCKTLDKYIFTFFGFFTICLYRSGDAGLHRLKSLCSLFSSVRLQFCRSDKKNYFSLSDTIVGANICQDVSINAPANLFCTIVSVCM